MLRIQHRARPCLLPWSARSTGRVLVDNGVPGDRIRLIEATGDNTIPVDAPLDLVSSLPRGHRPGAGARAPAAGGRLILDVRADQGGDARLARRFGRVDIVRDLGRAVRLAATR